MQVGKNGAIASAISLNRAYWNTGTSSPHKLCSICSYGFRDCVCRRKQLRTRKFMLFFHFHLLNDLSLSENPEYLDRCHIDKWPSGSTIRFCRKTESNAEG